LTPSLAGEDGGAASLRSLPPRAELSEGSRDWRPLRIPAWRASGPVKALSGLTGSFLNIPVGGDFAELEPVLENRCRRATPGAP
jgi:hypothetical protein